MTRSRHTARGLQVAAGTLIAGTALLFSSGVTWASTGDAHGSHGASAAATGSSSQGDSGHTGAGDRNAGDVWTDNVGQPAGPGHEQDPHLTCSNINLWGAGLADGSGTYIIDGQPPSGSREQDYASTWTYSASTGGSQVISVIDVQKLVATAIAHGDVAKNANGLHFKLNLVQDPQKHKTFWVSCPLSASPSSHGQGTGSTSSHGTDKDTDTDTDTNGTDTDTGAANDNDNDNAGNHNGTDTGAANDNAGNHSGTDTGATDNSPGDTTAPIGTTATESNTTGPIAGAGSAPADTATVTSPAGGVEGITTSSQTPTVSPSTAVAPAAVALALPGGVLGLSIGTPATGAGIAMGLALALIGSGAGLVSISRRRRDDV